MFCDNEFGRVLALLLEVLGGAPLVATLRDDPFDDLVCSVKAWLVRQRLSYTIAFHVMETRLKRDPQLIVKLGKTEKSSGTQTKLLGEYDAIRVNNGFDWFE